jgi:hypothetical protein
MVLWSYGPIVPISLAFSRSPNPPRVSRPLFPSTVHSPTGTMKHNP